MTTYSSQATGIQVRTCNVRRIRAPGLRSRLERRRADGKHAPAHPAPHYDNFLVITRGGMAPACLISERSGIRNILCAAVVLYEGEARALPEPVLVEPLSGDGRVPGAP